MKRTKFFNLLASFLNQKFLNIILKLKVRFRDKLIVVTLIYLIMIARLWIFMQIRITIILKKRICLHIKCRRNYTLDFFYSFLRIMSYILCNFALLNFPFELFSTYSFSKKNFIYFSFNVSTSKTLTNL